MHTLKYMIESPNIVFDTTHEKAPMYLQKDLILLNRIYIELFKLCYYFELFKLCTILTSCLLQQRELFHMLLQKTVPTVLVHWTVPTVLLH